jgi:hypothetical protein
MTLFYQSYNYKQLIEIYLNFFLHLISLPNLTKVPQTKGQSINHPTLLHTFSTICKFFSYRDVSQDIWTDL